MDKLIYARKLVEPMSRQQLELLLNGICIDCRDDEPMHDLREAVIANVLDGDLLIADLEEVAT